MTKAELQQEHRWLCHALTRLVLATDGGKVRAAAGESRDDLFFALLHARGVLGKVHFDAPPTWMRTLGIEVGDRP